MFKKRREIAIRYNDSFANIVNLKIPENNDSIDHSYHLYPLQIDFDKLSISKRELFNKLRESNLNLQVHYIPVHLQPFYQKNYRFNIGDYPVSENFYRNEVSLPIYPDLTTDDISLVVNNIMKIISK